MSTNFLGHHKVGSVVASSFILFIAFARALDLHIELVDVLYRGGLLEIDLASKLHRLSLTDLLSLLLLSVLIMALRPLFAMLLSTNGLSWRLLVRVFRRL